MNPSHLLPLPDTDPFATMQPGSVVVLFQGAGYPHVEEMFITEVILAVDGFSALTNTGRMLDCSDAGKIDPLGEVLADGDYEVSQEAAQILAQANAKTAVAPSDWDVELL